MAERSLRALEEKLLEYTQLKWKGKLTWTAAVEFNVVAAAKRERPDENARAIATFVEVLARILNA